MGSVSLVEHKHHCSNHTYRDVAVGAAAGTIGAVAGIAAGIGSIVAYLGYRNHTNISDKALVFTMTVGTLVGAVGFAAIAGYALKRWDALNAAAPIPLKPARVNVVPSNPSVRQP